MMDSPPIQRVSIAPARGEAFPPGVLRVDYDGAADGVADWALLWPPDCGGTWVVNIHGRGSHGDQLFTRADIRRDWLSEFRRRGLGVLAPNLRGTAWMSPAAAGDMHGLLDLVRARFGAERFVFVSGSMGGTSTLIYAILAPEDVAGAVAMCPATDLASLYAHYHGRADTREVAESLADVYGGTPTQQRDLFRRHSALRNCERLTMPVYIAHGDADGLIPVAESRALAAAGDRQRLKYREIPGGGHDAPLAAEFLAEGLEWVLDSRPEDE
jgi:pimeloyl-ACP methyl ester carboxylesterase